MVAKSRLNFAAVRAAGIALAATFFFSMTFVLNRRLVVGGGHWQWAVTLRYLITFSILTGVIFWRDGLGTLPSELRRHWKPWLLWSSVGFGMFGICLTWAASSGPAWLVAGAFQFTVIAGPLLAPFIYSDTRRHLGLGPIAVGLLIVFGVSAMQFSNANGKLSGSAILACVAVLLSACAYPLGNRMIMLHLESSGAHLTATQRVYGMTFMSLPIWLGLAAVTGLSIGLPDLQEVEFASGVALCSGVIATVLFFGATETVRHNRIGLAAVEAMQAGELLFSVLVGVLFFREPRPRGMAALGVVAVIAGIIIFNVLGALEIPVTAVHRGDQTVGIEKQ
jgi:drug/metabolite transporter (DMT)-like permease